MSDKSKGQRLAAVLFFVAAALAFTAYAIGYYSANGPVKVSTAFAGMFCVGMGLSMWSASRSAKP